MSTLTAVEAQEKLRERIASTLASMPDAAAVRRSPDLDIVVPLAAIDAVLDALSTPPADTSDGLVDAPSAEKFQQAVEQRLSETSHEEPGTEKEQAADADPDEDNPVTMDNPE